MATILDQAAHRDLESAIERIWTIATDLGLDPIPTHFEVVPASIMYEIGSYGMPGRFAHWTHGKSYYLQKTMYDYGLSKIYELVINTDPCWAFLLDTNSHLENQFVVAHVLGHSDFFRHNAYFQRTSRRMLETIRLNAERIREYEFEHGVGVVEQTLDAVLSIQEHVAPWESCELPLAGEDAAGVPEPYDDLWRLDGGEAKDPGDERRARVQRCKTPQQDLLLFLAVESPALEEWQRDIIQMVRGEMLYFYPQMQTKIINEGWASYWHVQILRALELSVADHIEFARLHAGVVQSNPGRLNPYYLGFTILRDIERRYDEEMGEGAGRDQLFQVRETESDVSLIRNYLTKELVDELDLYFAEREGNQLIVTEKSWEGVRDRLVDQLVDFGIPTITAEDADYNGNRELFLKHHWTGQPLDPTWTDKTLEGIQSLWGRAVWLETRRDDNVVRLRYLPGEGHSVEGGE